MTMRSGIRAGCMEIATAARGHLTGEKSYQREPCPLAKLEGTKELRFRMLESRADAVNSRWLHGAPREVTMKGTAIVQVGQ